MNKSIDNRFQAFAERMKQEEVFDVVIDTFGYYYQLIDGGTDYISEEEIKSIIALSDLEGFVRAGQKVIPKTIMIKLNGGRVPACD